MRVMILPFGAESTTARMQKCGWNFTADQNIADGTLTVIGRDEYNKMYMIGERINVDYFRAAMDGHYLKEIKLFFNRVVTDIIISRDSQDINPFINYAAVDMTPQITEVRIDHIEDFKLFAEAPLGRTQEIIVEEKSVTQLMDEILAKQEEGRIEYFKKQIRDDTTPHIKTNLHAQIVSIA